MQSERKSSQCGAYQIMRTIGKGAFAKVKLGYNSIQNQHVALKIFKGQQSLQENLQLLSTEINVLSQLSHTNLIRMISYNQAMLYQKKNGQQLNRVVLVLEYASGGELFEYVYRTGPFSEGISRYYFKQLIEGLSYLHQKNIAHRDLKPENLLFNSQFQLKIADFGLSASINKHYDQKFKSNLGTPGYQAPEIIARHPYDGIKSDIFATGVILYVMHSGTIPFNHASSNDQRYKLIMDGKFERFYQRSRQGTTQFSSDLQDLLNGLLHPDPLQRWSIQQIQASNWYQGYVIPQDQIELELAARKEKVDHDNRLILQQFKIQKEKNTRPQGVHVPFGKFKSQDDHNIIVQVPRQIKVKQINLEYIPKNTIISDLDENMILTLLANNQNKFSNLLKIDEEYFKIQVFYENEENAYNYQIELIKTQDDIRLLIFTKPEYEEGTPYLDDFELKKKIDQIRKILTDQFQE